MAKKESVKKRPKWLVFPLAIVIILVLYILWVTRLSLPPVKPVPRNSLDSASVAAISFAWPNYGQSAIGIGGYGVLATSGIQKPLPTASVAKIITALSVLNKKPLAVGQSGPIITLSQADVNILAKYNAEQGSDVTIVAGEKLSEYQMLEAMLLPSGDNIADSLAIWAFGSLSSYSTYANQYVQSQGLTSTHVGVDASGYDPSTTSTPNDLIKLGELALNNPVIAQIVNEPTAAGIPVVISIKNVNNLLGTNNIIGIKTGNTTPAGGVFLSASKETVNNQPLVIYTAVMQAPTLWQAMNSSLSLIKSAQSNFSNPLTSEDINTGKIVGSYKVPWNNQTINAVLVTQQDIQTWQSTKAGVAIKLNNISLNTKTGDAVGVATISSQIPKTSVTINVLSSASVNKPTKWWLITHPSKLVNF